MTGQQLARSNERRPCIARSGEDAAAFVPENQYPEMTEFLDRCTADQQVGARSANLQNAGAMDDAEALLVLAHRQHGIHKPEDIV